MKPAEIFPVTLSLLVLLGGGCRLMQTAADIPGEAVRTVTPGKKNQQPVDPVEEQQTLARFADEYLARMVIGVDQLRRGANVADPAEALQWKIAITTNICSIASGPNPVANLLDLTVFVTLTRRSLEEYWQPRFFGESASPMLETCRNAETEIWKLSAAVLTPEQQGELRQTIDVWQQQNPLPEHALAARAVGLAAQAAQAGRAGATRSDSVFGLLGVDPLAGMAPAVREMAQTRLFAERALYVIQKQPMLLRWQLELLSVNAVEMPAVRQVVANSTRLTASLERFADVAEKLPGQIRTEREQTLEAIQSQTKGLAALSAEVRQTLAEGTAMSASLTTTFGTFDALMKRFGIGETKSASPPNPNAEPFRIQDYAQTAAQLEATARRLTELLVTLDQTMGSTNLKQLSAQVAPAVEKAQAGGKEIVDYAFWRVLLVLAAALAAALVYRFLGGRRARGPRPPTSPSPTPNPKSAPVTTSTALCLLAAAMFTGCIHLGPRTIPADRFDYSSAIADSWKQQTLLNIVKLRYTDLPVFVDVSSIVSGYSLQTGVNVNGTISSEAAIQGNFLSMGGQAIYTDRPTITYIPLTGEKFMRGLILPIDPKNIFFLLQSGYPADFILALTVEGLNGLRNRTTAGGKVREADPEFVRVLELLREVQAVGAFGMRVEEVKAKSASAVVFFRRDDVSAEALEKVMEIRRLLKLPPDQQKFTLTYSPVRGGENELAVSSRSMLQIMTALSSYLDVPEEHLKENRAWPAFENAAENIRQSKVRIRSGKSKPADAFAAVRYSNYWYWIDGGDWQTKRAFTAVMFFFTLAETGGNEPLPLITIPAQ